MKHIKFSTVFCLLFSICMFSALGNESAPLATGDFSGHDAVILSATARFDHVFTMEMSMETFSYKIKFLTQKGIEDYGHGTVTYHPKTETIGTLEGTVTLPNGQVIKIKKSDIFEKDIVEKGRRKVTEIKIAFPSLEPGAIVDYTFTRSFNGSRMVSHWPFQSELFTVSSEVTFLPWPSNPWGYTSRNAVTEPEIKETKPGGNKAVTVTRTNIPGLPREDYSLSYSSLRESIDFYYVDSDSGHEDYWTKGMTRIYKKGIKPFMKVCPEIREIVSREFQNVPKENEEMINALFNYVVKNHVALSMMTKKEEMEVDDSYRKKLLKADKISELLPFKYVTDWQINYILASLIKAAVPAAEIDLALYIPWDEDSFNPSLKSIEQFTDCMLRVRCDGKTYWLAPAKRFMPAGVMDWAAKGVNVLFLNEETATIEKIPLEKDSDNPSATTAQVTFDTEEGFVVLKQQATGNKYVSYDMRSLLLYIAEQEQKDLLEAGIKELFGSEAELVSFSLTNLENLSEPLIIDMEYRFPYEFEEAGTQILMDFPGFDRPKENPFLADTRNGPVCFQYPYKENQEITYTLSDGYKIKSCPSNVRINQKILLYHIDYEKISDKQFKLKSEVTLQGNMLKKEAASFFRDTYSDILESNRKKLVLVEE